MSIQQKTEASDSLKSWSAGELDRIAGDLESKSAEDVLRWTVDQFHPKLYVACSFQKEASVIMDMLLKIEPEGRFFTLDTDLLFPETYEIWQKLEKHYGIKVDRYHGISLEEQKEKYGDELWLSDTDKCCELRKVEPLKRALASVDGWISGLRRDQSESRADTKKIIWDERFELVKANPLADWTEKDVWSYIAENEVPYNPLHDRGYPSIGCIHCTESVGKDDDGRSGRWSGSEKIECGLHEPTLNNRDQEKEK